MAESAPTEEDVKKARKAYEKAANLQNQQMGSGGSKLRRSEKQGQWSKRVTVCPVGGLVNSVWISECNIAPPLCNMIPWTV